MHIFLCSVHIFLCKRAGKTGWLLTRFIFRRKRFKSFRLCGTGEPVIETGKYEIFRKPFMDYNRRCEMDCVKASKWIFFNNPIDVSIEHVVDLHTDKALPVLVK